MSTSDNALYSVIVDLQQNSVLSFREFSALDELYCDPDFFYFDEDAYEISFLPISGHYNVVLDKLNGTLSAQRVNADGSEVTLQADGTGAIWVMGWGLGSPSQNSQFGWDPGKAYQLAQISEGVYQFTGQAGPENGSVYGDRYRFDYLSFKFFHQNGWGGEFGGGSLKPLGETTSFIKQGDDGNFGLANGNLEEGATYRMTIDLTAGVENASINMEKL